MVTLRSKGPGPTTLAQGNTDAGYYGKVTDVITGTELLSKCGITVGTTNNAGDITWLKFSHNGKTLLVADRVIQTFVSWDYLEEKDVIFGKEVKIGEYNYLARSLKGSNINPCPNETGASLSSTVTGQNSEWDKLIVALTPNKTDSNWQDMYTLCQEVHSISHTARILRGYNSTAYLSTNTSNSAGSNYGWRPVLEVL